MAAKSLAVPGLVTPASGAAVMLTDVGTVGVAWRLSPWAPTTKRQVLVIWSPGTMLRTTLPALVPLAKVQVASHGAVPAGSMKR